VSWRLRGYQQRNAIRSKLDRGVTVLIRLCLGVFSWRFRLEDGDGDLCRPLVLLHDEIAALVEYLIVLNLLQPDRGGELGAPGVCPAHIWLTP